MKEHNPKPPTDMGSLDLGGVEVVLRLYRGHHSVLVRALAIIYAWGSLLVFLLAPALCLFFSIRAESIFVRVVLIGLSGVLCFWCFRYAMRLWKASFEAV
jgi:hypothetical protein